MGFRAAQNPQSTGGVIGLLRRESFQASHHLPDAIVLLLPIIECLEMKGWAFTILSESFWGRLDRLLDAGCSPLLGEPKPDYRMGTPRRATQPCIPKTYFDK